MKLFIVAALIAVAAAGRLEHLERSYLPPDNNGGSQGNFGSSGGPNGFGSQGLSGFGQNSNGGFGSSSFGQGSNGFGAHGSNSRSGLSRNNGLSNGAFGAATSNQYLPPDHGPSGSASNGFGNFGVASNRPSGNFGSFGSQGSQYRQPQIGGPSRQYLAPKSSSSQNSPQQAFDEETGYHY